jgi:CO/xanthine dehydrogenase Mo-binding subunit
LPPIYRVAPAVENAILNAIGVNIDANPFTPEKVQKDLKRIVVLVLLER